MDFGSNALLLSFGSVALVSIVSLAGIFALLMTGRFLRRIIFILVSLSVGVLFGDVFIHIIPELYAIEGVSEEIPVFILGGIILFFTLEKFFRWGHEHEHSGHTNHSAEELKPSRKVNSALGRMIIAGDTLHNFLDGVILTAAYLITPELGFATLIAVLLHEIPQEIGDFGSLLHAGYGKSKALLYNFFSALGAFAGWALTIAIGSSLEEFTLIALSLAAGGFIYIAGSDLVPELQKRASLGKSILQLLAMLLGFVVMFALLSLE